MGLLNMLSKLPSYSSIASRISNQSHVTSPGRELPEVSYQLKKQVKYQLLQPASLSQLLLWRLHSLRPAAGFLLIRLVEDSSNMATNPPPPRPAPGSAGAQLISLFESLPSLIGQVRQGKLNQQTVIQVRLVLSAFTAPSRISFTGIDKRFSLLSSD